MRYKVKALNVGGKGNKIFKSGDEVSEKNFPPGAVEQLVAQGFLEPIAEVTAPVEEKKDPAPAANTQVVAPPADEKKPKEKYEDISMKALKEYLTKAGVKFSNFSDKKTLYDLYVKN